MDTQVRLIVGESDWLATRLSPYKFYPPKTSVNTESTTVLGKRPTVICLSGIEGIGIVWGKYKGQRSLLFQIAHSTPFVDEVRQYVRVKKGVWNDVFNTWDIPILSQGFTSALKEIWVNIEEVYFELSWAAQIDLHWLWSIEEKNFRVLDRRIQQLNNFWQTGEIHYEVSETEIVYVGLSREEVEREAIATFLQLCPHATWLPTSNIERVCVNYLRHKCSCYHVLLKTGSSYKSVFNRVSKAHVFYRKLKM